MNEHAPHLIPQTCLRAKELATHEPFALPIKNLDHSASDGEEK